MTDMRTYAHVLDGQVREILTTDGDIAEMFHAALVWIDVTALSPQPAAGWLYDGKTFTAPPAPAWTPPIRTATSYKLMKALTDAQRTAYKTTVKEWDQRFFSNRDTPWPEGNIKLGRIADALGTTAKAWFDAALGAAG